MKLSIIFSALCVFITACSGSDADIGRDLKNVVTDGYAGFPISIPYLPQYGPGTGVSMSYDSPRMVRTATGFQPEGIHLTPWGRTRMLVSWTTGAPNLGPTSSPPPAVDPNCNAPFCFTKLVEATVQYGLAPGKYAYNATGSNSAVYRYIYDQSVGGVTYQSPILHHVILENIFPGAVYYYRVGNNKDGWSSERKFKLPSVNQYPTRIGAFGDLGDTWNSSNTVDLLTAGDPDFLIFTGDHTYADNHLSNATDDQNAPYSAYYTGNNTIKPAYPWFDPLSDQRRWDSWARFMDPLLSTKPMLASSGDNHGLENQALQNNLTFLSQNARFPLPGYAGLSAAMQANSVNNFILSPFYASGDARMRTFNNDPKVVANNSYYGVDIGPVHVIGLNHYMPYGPDSPQASWFKYHVKNVVNRQKTPWLIVAYHTSSYHTYQVHFRESDSFLATWEPLFKDAGVDIVFNGHVHAYERTYPVYNYALDNCAPVYITVGDGGNTEQLYRAFMDEVVAAANYNLTNVTFSSGGNCKDGPNPATFLPSYQPTPDGLTTVSFPDSFNKSFCPQSQPNWSAFREPAFGAGFLDILSPTKAVWTWRRVLPGASDVVDNATIVKTAACPNQYFVTPSPLPSQSG